MKNYKKLKEKLKKSLINYEKIQPFYPAWEDFMEPITEPTTLEDYKKNMHSLYNDWILYKAACGETKNQIKSFLIEKIKILNYKTIDKCNKWDKALLETLINLVNEYFSMLPIIEHHY